MKSRSLGAHSCAALIETRQLLPVPRFNFPQTTKNAGAAGGGPQLYQLRRSIRSMKGSPSRLAVAVSEVTFPNNCGFLKSTVPLGAFKP